MRTLRTHRAQGNVRATAWGAFALSGRQGLLVALGAALLVAVGVWLGLRLARWVLRRRAARARRSGAKGAQAGLRLLAKHGFRIEQTEATAEAWMELDGARVRYVVRADALVRRGKAVFVAELKGGAKHGSPRHRSTRRQLFEYACVFGVDGVLLVDAATRRIHVVRFPRLMDG